MDFLDGDSWSALVDTAPSYMAAWRNSGYSMIWGIPILPYDSTTYSLADGAAGDYNPYFSSLAQDMVAGGQGSSIVRIGWEFNGGWFPWAANGQAAAFIGYWQQIVNTMRSVPGQDFKFEWNPNIGDLGVGNLADYYPGNAYVDDIGLDVYDVSWASYPGATEFADFELRAGRSRLALLFRGVSRQAHHAARVGPRLGAGERWRPTLGSRKRVGGGDDPTFINDMAQWIRDNDVEEATFWDFGSGAISPTSNPNSYAAFVNDFGDGSPTSTTPLPATPTGATGSGGIPRAPVPPPHRRRRPSSRPPTQAGRRSRSRARPSPS